MTESTQLQTAENNNAGVVKMEPLPPATTASTANTNLATSPAPSSVMEQQTQQQQTAAIISATLQQQQQQLQQQQQQQQYALKWNDYQTSMLSSFRHLRDEEDFVDVTLACDERSFTAHKVVLSACSPYFRKLLKANPCEHPIVILRDVPADDVENLLSFMYNGEVNVGHEHLPEFLKTAHLLQIRGLADVNNGSSASFTPTLASSTPSNKLSSSLNSQLSGSTNKLNFLTAATQALSNSSNSPFTTPSLGSTTPLNNLLNNTSSSNINNNNSSNNHSNNNNNNNNSSSNNNNNKNNNNSNNGNTPAIQELKASSASPANHWDLSDSDSNRNNHLTPPPQKRIKSADLFRAQHGISPERLLIDREFPVAGQHPLTRNRDRSRETSHDRDREMRESLLGQALENTNGLQKQHPDMASLHAQSAGEDSNSSDTEPSDRGDGQHDGTMDSMDNQRTHSFPNAFLGLQGIPGLLPGPSGMAANDFAADVQQNLGKFLSTTQIKEELKEDEDLKELDSTHKDTLSEPAALADKRELRENNSPHRPSVAHLSPDQNHLLVSHLNNNIVKHRSTNSSPARSIRSWHDSDDENFIDDDGASSISSAISLTMKTSRHNSESTLYQALLKKQQQQQHHQQQQHQQQHMITDGDQQMPTHQRHRTDHTQPHQHSHQQQQQQEHQQHKHQQQHQQQQQQQYLDELQQTAVTHQQQLTANLLMARTIAFSRSRDFPELFQNPAAVAAAAAAAATASAASANAAAAAASSSNYMLPCPLCETPLEQRVFRQHLDRHYPRDSPVCPVIECGRRFAHPNSVRNHMRIKHTLQWAKMKAMRSSGGPFAGGPDFK